MMAPAYEQAAAELASEGRLAKVDTEAEPDVAARFGIRSIPTLIAFRNGREVARQSGAMDLPGLLPLDQGQRLTEERQCHRATRPIGCGRRPAR